MDTKTYEDIMHDGLPNPPKKKVLLFNASALKNMDCARKIYYTILEGYTQPLPNNDTHYGTCYHLYQSVLAETNEDTQFAVAMRAAEKLFRDTTTHVKSKKEYLDINHLRRTCTKHFTQIKPTDDFEILKGMMQCKTCRGNNVECSDCKNSSYTLQPLVELKFHIPYYSDDYIDVILVGTVDKLGKFRSGAYAIGDYKTTASWNQKEYLENYGMSPQLMFYLLLVKKYAEMYPDSVFAELNKHQKIGAFIDGVFLSSTKETEFRRSEVFFYSDVAMQEFEEMLHMAVMKVVNIYKKNHLIDWMPQRTGLMTQACLHNFGNRCQYFNACAAPNNIIAGHVLKNNFTQKEYGMSTYGGEIE